MAGSPLRGFPKAACRSRYTVVNRKEVGSMMLDNIPAQGTDFAAAEPRHHGRKITGYSVELAIIGRSRFIQQLAALGSTIESRGMFFP